MLLEFFFLYLVDEFDILSRWLWDLVSIYYFGIKYSSFLWKKTPKSTDNYRSTEQLARWSRYSSKTQAIMEHKHAKKKAPNKRVIEPACETLNPASSISWSRENAPIDMRSLSSAAALAAVRYYRLLSTAPAQCIQNCMSGFFAYFRCHDECVCRRNSGSVWNWKW